MKHSILLTSLISILLLSACGASVKDASTATSPNQTVSESVSAQQPQSEGLTRTDGQGAVTFEVTPLNLNDPVDTLQFNVSMNTHSVDLSMDLAPLATLTTDTGMTVQATLWDAPKGGHHLMGKLSFPVTQNGQSLLAGVKRLTLTIKNVDAPERTFSWDLPAK